MRELSRRLMVTGGRHRPDRPPAAEGLVARHGVTRPTAAPARAAHRLKAHAKLRHGQGRRAGVAERFGLQPELQSQLFALLGQLKQTLPTG